MKQIKENIANKINSTKSSIKDNKKLYLSLKIISGILIFAVIIVLLFYSFRKMDFSQIEHIKLNWFLIIISLILFASSGYFKAASFAFGFAKDKITFSEAIRFTLVGNALNLIMPFKLGEGIRLSLYPKKFTVTERGRFLGLAILIDACIIIVFMLFAAFFAAPGETYIKEGYKYSDFLKTAFLVMISVCTVSVLIAMVFKKTRELLKFTILGGHFKKSFIYSGLTWFTNYLSVVFALCAFSNLDVLLSIKIALSVIIFTNLAMIIPATPGSIGIFELMVVFAFAASGKTAEEGIIAGIVLHLIQYVTLLPIGGFLYLKGRIKNRNETID